MEDELIKDIAEEIENSLSWSNGWTIPKEEYTHLCKITAERISEKFIRKDGLYWTLTPPDTPCIFVAEKDNIYEIYRLIYEEDQEKTKLICIDSKGNFCEDINRFDKYLILIYTLL